MSSHPVKLAPFHLDHTAKNGPIDVERRTLPNGLVELSAGIVRFPQGGRSDPWTLPYEEAFYVIEGRLMLHVGEETVEVPAGEVVTLEKGCTVEYEGEVGTVAFFCLVPANWLETSGQ